MTEKTDGTLPIGDDGILLEDSLCAVFRSPCWRHKLEAARAAAHITVSRPNDVDRPQPSSAVSTVNNISDALKSPKGSRFSDLTARSLPLDFSSWPHPSSRLPESPARDHGAIVVLPEAMPRRKSPRDPQGLVELVHALAQIELAAIEIDCAQLWLYPHAPAAWHRDMAGIVLDECRHFELLEACLVEWGSPFGSLPVHHALWRGFRAGLTWLEHLALTVRYQEANGVDASYALVCAAESAQKHTRLHQMQDLLNTLHKDEIKHVAVGSYWWNWAFLCGGVEADQQKRDEAACSSYFDIVESRVSRPWARRFPFYIEGRRRAGFTPKEIATFQSLQAEKDAADRHNALASQRKQHAKAQARRETS